MNEIVGKTISELKTLLAKKQVSAREILDAHYKHIDKLDSQIGSFNLLTYELAQKQAQQVDKLIAAGAKLPPLAGIPVAIKDNICVSGYKTTCSSMILADFVSPYEATAYQRLSSAGTLCIGKTNMDEFAMGSSTENSSTKKTCNPWNTNLVPGGSSGGSAAAVSSGQAVVALGSDTGGSIRQPASFCGIVGMKPTYGTVSRFGLVAFASSLDQIGPFGRTVEDVASTLSVITGHCHLDSTSLNISDQNYLEHLTDGVKNIKIGVIKELIGEGIDESVKKSILDAAETYKKLGAHVEEVSLPYSKYALPVYYIIATAEASANLARFDGVKYGYRDKDANDINSMYFSSRSQGFGPEVKLRIMLGTYALSSGYYDAYYKKAQQVRRLIKQDYETVFSKFDILLCPTTPTVAFPIGSKTNDPLQMYLSDIATIPANLAGIPGISLPCGFDHNGLPIGMQLLAPALEDAKLLKVAYAFEQATNFHTKQPSLLSKS